MSLKPSVVADFDSRRALFHHIVQALDVLPSSCSWDLSWGEPFLALSSDHKIWVRVFYEESLPLTIDRMRAEVERLTPHVGETGKLILCIPDVWARALKMEPFTAGFDVCVLGYTTSIGQDVVMRELRAPVKETQETTFPLMPQLKVDVSERLLPEELRELTEIGVEIKRYTTRKADEALFTP